MPKVQTISLEVTLDSEDYLIFDNEGEGIRINTGQNGSLLTTREDLEMMYDALSVLLEEIELRNGKESGRRTEDTAVDA